MNKEEYMTEDEYVIHMMKELGEIAEVLVKRNRPDHWKNELGDFCTFGIAPTLRLAGVSFEEAIEVGMTRKNKKKKNINIQDKANYESHF